MSAGTDPLLLAYFGDDFTGSTDALESLSMAGLRTVLFMDVPTSEELDWYDGLAAIGVAGITRSLPTESMEIILRPAFGKLRDLNPRFIHYKVCSTFDSSPAIGSIGKVLEIALDIFPGQIIPIMVAAPWLGRYMAFGNLFARMGIGSNGAIYRLDRHPSMNHHPVTPAHESDLRLHLAKQTDIKTALIDFTELDETPETLRSRINEMKDNGFGGFFIDALDEKHLSKIGGLLNHLAEYTTPLFSIGSSGIGMAIGKYVNDSNIFLPRTDWRKPAAVKPLLVISGSFSPVTAGQIAWALKNGFEQIELDMELLGNAADPFSDLHHYHDQALEILTSGKNLLIHSGRKVTGFILSPVLLGGILGKLARDLVQPARLSRVVISGGDTSGYAARAMGIVSLEMISPVVPGAPLCLARAPGSPVDGIELNFKGGQVGGEDYFGLLAG